MLLRSSRLRVARRAGPHVCFGAAGIARWMLAAGSYCHAYATVLPLIKFGSKMPIC
ncbi:hypothetical protein BCAR13_1710020 [Paraburkholderia caribensis]|nr:hypothetical protein BCAR13_1710020 [Paraburkholderia caribensis]